MNIRFMDGDTFVAGGDYFVPAGVQNYSVLEKYVPEGYKMSVAGDFMAEDDAKLDVPVEKINKTVGLNFWDVVNNVQAGEGELKVAADATYVNTSKITPPEGYELTVTGDLDIRDGWVYVEVKPSTKTVGLNFWDIVNNTQVTEGKLDVDADATYVNTSKITPPEGYELTVTGDLDIRDGWVYVEVKPVEKAKKTITLNFWDDVNNKQVKEVPMEVDADATEVWTGDITPPDGYWFVSSGKLAIRDGYVFVPVKPAEKPTKTVGLNFYDEVNNKPLPEGAVNVPSDATHVNTGMIELPEGYEFTVTGDLDIHDGWVYVGVKPVEKAKKTITLNFWDDVNNKQVKEVPMEVDADATEVWTGDITPPDGYWFVSSGKLAIRDGYVFVPVKPAEKPTKTVGLNFYDEVNNKPLPEGAVNVPSDATHVNISMITPPAGYEFTETGDLTINDGYVYVGVKPIEPPVEMVTFKVNYVDNGTRRSVGDAYYTLPVGSYRTGDFGGSVPSGYTLLLDRIYEVTSKTNYIEVIVVPEVVAMDASEQVTAEETTKAPVVEENGAAAVTDKQTVEVPASDAAEQTVEVPASDAAEQTVEVPASDVAEQTAETPAADDAEQVTEKDTLTKPDNTPKSEKAEEKNIMQTILDKLQGKK